MAKPAVAVLFANLKGNIGDFAILHAMLLDLKRKFPGRALHVFSLGRHTIDERRLAAFRSSSQVEFELVGTTYFQKVPAAARIIGLWPVAQPYLARALAARFAHDAVRFRDYEAIFLAGGDRGGGANLTINFFGTLAAVHGNNDRIYAYPFSVGPQIRKRNSLRSLQDSFRRIQDPLVVRDGISKSVLDGMGLNCVLGADCVFSLEDLAAEVEPVAGRDASRILLSVTRTGGNLGADVRAFLKNAGDLRPRLALLTTCEPEDGEQYEVLARELAIPWFAPATWQETVAEIKASSLLVTNRLHGLILGALANTPLLPVTDRKKSEAFAKDARIPHSAPSVRDVTGAQLERCRADRDAILDRIGHYRDWVRSAARAPLMTATRAKFEAGA